MTPSTDAPATRRERLDAEAATRGSVLRRRTPGPMRRGAVPADSSRAASAVLARSSAPQPQRRAGSFRRRVLPAVVITITAGMFGTVALPALAAGSAPGTDLAGAGVTNVAKSQSLTISDVAAIADTSRDGYGATSQSTLDAQKAATDAAAAQKAAAAVEAARASTAASYSYSGETAADYVANPKYPSFSLSQVASVAQQYIGTPYVFGGDTPAGFDCSGFVMYVYAQFGISLQHSVPLQDAVGTRISEADAQPGDVVVFDNEEHDGFYMGNGMILDAPKPGGTVQIRPIWDQPHHFVRFGING